MSQNPSNKQSYQSRWKHILFGLTTNTIALGLNWIEFNPCPPADAFWRNNSRRLLKTLWPKVKLLMMSNFSIGHHVFNFIQQLSYLLWRFFMFLSLRFQSRLLQICCMWKRVNTRHKKGGLISSRRFRAISSFSKMFSKFVCCRCKKASVWGKRLLNHNINHTRPG